MATIEERAKEYAHQYRRDAHDLKGERADAAFAAYCQGAEDECKELTKWNNPKDKLPPDDREVLCMIDCCYNTYLILKHNDLGWWMLASNGGRCVCAFEVIGWREINE